MHALSLTQRSSDNSITKLGLQLSWVTLTRQMLPDHLFFFQQLTISPALLEALGHINSHISNIVSLGPIIFLSALEKTAFTSPVTMTIPSPPKARGQQGHLVVVSVCNDNTCIPCARR